MRFPSGLKAFRAVSLPLAVALAACAPAPPATVTTSPSPTAAAASPTPTPAATASATPAPSAEPSVAASQGMSGTVYDLDGNPVPGAALHVTSLEAATPFEASATADDGGRYSVAEALPPGVNLAFDASKAGWTTRRRVVAMGPTTAHTLDFGAPKPTFSGDAAPYFLSDLPEVQQLDPVTDGNLADPTHFHLQLAVNAGLDAANQLRFAQALRILPANSAALDGVGGVTSLADKEDAAFPDDRQLVLGAYTIKPGIYFRSDSSTGSTLSWNADGTVATFDFVAAPIANRRDPAGYQIALSAGKDPVVDKHGHQLGTSTTGSFSGYPPIDNLVPSAFQTADFKLAPIPGLDPATRESRWASTHDDAGRFRVAVDRTPPHLMGISIAPSGEDARIALSFDESLAAFDGTTGGRVGAGLDVAHNDVMAFTFALAAHHGDLADLTLTGKDAETFDPRTTSILGVEGDRHRELRFAPSAIVGTRTGAVTGNVVLELDPKNPKRVLLTVVGLAHLLHPDIVEIKARVQGIGDPAFNVGDEDDANQHLYTGDL